MRTETTTRELYKFEELDDDAKETAREWWRRCENESVDNFFAECVIEDAERVAEILGVSFNRRRGGRSSSPAVYWSGFWSQGNGACFEGAYTYQSGASKMIREYAPKDAELHWIADELAKVQKRYFYALSATCEHSGHYYHSGCMSVCVRDDRDGWRGVPDDDEETIRQLLRDFADWIYRQLERAYEFTMSDENVDESMIANEYEFDIHGNIS